MTQHNAFKVMLCALGGQQWITEFKVPQVIWNRKTYSEWPQLSEYPPFCVCLSFFLRAACRLSFVVNGMRKVACLFWTVLSFCRNCTNRSAFPVRCFFQCFVTALRWKRGGITLVDAVSVTASCRLCEFSRVQMLSAGGDQLATEFLPHSEDVRFFCRSKARPP